MGSVLLGPAINAPGDTSERSTTAKVPVGTRGVSDKGEFVYIGAAGTIAVNTPAGIAGTLDACVAADAGVAEFLGVADAAFASGEYGYVQVKGECECVVASGAVAGEELELTSTAGLIGPLASGTAIGVAVDASDDAGNVAVTIYLR